MELDILDIKRYEDTSKLLLDISSLQNIHIECNQEQGNLLFQNVRLLESQYSIGYVIETDQGYERYSVSSYLKFWISLHDSKETIHKLMERFDLLEIAKKNLKRLSPSERMRVQIARVSVQKVDLIFLQNPLFNLTGEALSKVLNWIIECNEAGICFITTNSSIRHALLMPGNAFYIEEDVFYKVEQDEESNSLLEEDDIQIIKIPAKSGNTTLLFEPKDIDFVESVNKNNYISVRGTLFQVGQNMSELEERLSKSGFFRCHRSYIVNMQKVDQIERLSKNTYTLLLLNKEKSRIPLAKGRVEDMKSTFGW